MDGLFGKMVADVERDSQDGKLPDRVAEHGVPVEEEVVLNQGKEWLQVWSDNSEKTHIVRCYGGTLVGFDKSSGVMWMKKKKKIGGKELNEPGIF